MIITRAPLRISFFGGGTDYPEHFSKHGGAVLATAIDKHTYLTANRFPSSLFDYSIRLSYRKSELVSNPDHIEHSVFRACLNHCDLRSDIELHTVADLPAYTGLGSSSSFTVALLRALHTFKEEYVSSLKLAYEAIHIERTLLKESVGCQDQTVAAVGGFNFIEFKDVDDIRIHPVIITKERLQELENSLYMVFTGIKRKAQDLAVKQIKKIDDNKDRLNKMRKMVDRGYEILSTGEDLSRFGELLHDGWVEKSALDSSISNSQINELYQQGIDAGAVGGKLLGAGGGGFVLFYVPQERQKKFEEAFSWTKMFRPQLNVGGSETVFARN